MTALNGGQVNTESITQKLKNSSALYNWSEKLSKYYFLAALILHQRKKLTGIHDVLVSNFDDVMWKLAIVHPLLI